MQIRKATVDDVPAMQELIATYAAEGLMLPRTEKSLYENLYCFVVADDGGTVAGTAGLHVLWRDLCEIRSLAVSAEYQGQGIGRALVQELVREAEERKVARVLSLTYQVEFFAKLGFQIVDKETLPHKIWRDCIHCSKFHHCDETAMVLYTQAKIPIAAGS